MEWSVKMKKNSIKVILFFFIISILFIGCAKNEFVMDMKFDKKINVGVISHVGNTLEYGYSGNTILMETKYLYTQINDWNIDRFIENEFKKQLLKRGFTNINIIYPTEKLILLKNEIKAYFYPEHKSELSRIAKEHNLDLLFYIENFVAPEEKTIIIKDKGSYLMKNLFVYAEKSFLSDEIEEVIFIPLNINVNHYKDKNKSKYDYSNAYRVNSKNLDKTQYITKNGVYDRKKLDELEPLFKELLTNIIDKYFKEKGI